MSFPESPKGAEDDPVPLSPPAEEELVLRTARLDLLPMTEADAPRMYDLLADPALYAYTGDAPPESVAALRRLYAYREARHSPDGNELWLNWIARDRSASGAAVGYFQATVDTTHADVAWVIGLPWQRRGFASEGAAVMVDWLVSRLGVTRVQANIRADHAASQGVATRLGLKRTTDLHDGEEVWRKDAVSAV
jgi:RimJ/RimL family protein N-acetyltransferase